MDITGASVSTASPRPTLHEIIPKAAQQRMNIAEKNFLNIKSPNIKITSILL